MNEPITKPDLADMKANALRLLEKFHRMPDDECLDAIVRQLGYFQKAWIVEAAERWEAK